MLLLDSDQREVAQATHGDELGELRPEETVALPLRRSQDYRNDSRQILEWLSRRWLFNIPRSQQTEGLRPLGRLALADHAEQALGKLRTAIESLHGRATKLGLTPRVVVCGSLCGGTGGGIVSDIVMAVRQQLDALQANSAQVLAVLTFGTTRNPQQQELATASGVAALTELAQFHRPGAVYPAEPALGLKQRPASAGGLDAAWLVHTGADLSNQQWEAACDKLSEFLLLESITPVGQVLRTAREQSDEVQGLPIRSFGLYQLGFAQDRLVDDAVRRVCRETIARWLGTPTQKPEARRQARLLATGSPAVVPATTPQPVAPAQAIEARAAEQARALGLEMDNLVQEAAQLAAAELGGDAEGFFRNLMIGESTADGPPLAQWLGAASELFGPPHGAGSQGQMGELAEALDQRIGPWVAELGAALKTSVEALVDDPAARVLGAKQASKWLQAHLKGLADKLRETHGRLEQESQAVAIALDPAQLAHRAKGKTPRRTPAELATLFQQYCRLRMFSLATQRAAQVAHSLQSHASGAHDALLDLAHELDHLTRQFPAEETTSCSASSTSLEFCSMRESVVEQLRQAEEPIAREIDEQLSKSEFAAKGGMRAALSEGGEAREQLLNLLRNTARQAVLAKLQTIDLASLLLAGAEADSPLRKVLTDAQPWLQCCGGRRRLIAVIPEQLAEHYSSATLAAQLGPNAFRQLPTIVPDSSSDLVLLYELGDISLPHVAAQLCDFRPDLLDAAGRLHTRCNIDWAPLVS
jgi:hypothetical protein